MKVTLLFGLSVACSLLISCKKEPAVDSPRTRLKSTIVQRISPTSQRYRYHTDDSTVFVYNEEGKVINFTSYSRLYQLTEPVPAYAPSLLANLIYDNQGRAEQLDYFYYQTVYKEWSRYHSYLLLYNANNELINLENRQSSGNVKLYNQVTYGTNSLLTLLVRNSDPVTSKISYEYNNSKNLTTATSIYSYFSQSGKLQLTYEHDDKLNPFQLLKESGFFLLPLLPFGFERFQLYHAPESRNNPVSIKTISSGEGMDLTERYSHLTLRYIYNAMNLPVEVQAFSEQDKQIVAIMRFVYE